MTLSTTRNTLMVIFKLSVVILSVVAPYKRENREQKDNQEASRWMSHTNHRITYKTRDLLSNRFVYQWRLSWKMIFLNFCNSWCFQNGSKCHLIITVTFNKNLPDICPSSFEKCRGDEGPAVIFTITCFLYYRHFTKCKLECIPQESISSSSKIRG